MHLIICFGTLCLYIIEIVSISSFLALVLQHIRTIVVCWVMVTYSGQCAGTSPRILKFVVEMSLARGLAYVLSSGIRTAPTVLTLFEVILSTSLRLVFSLSQEGSGQHIALWLKMLLTLP